MGSQLSYSLRHISQRQLCSLATSRAFNKVDFFFLLCGRFNPSDKDHSGGFLQNTRTDAYQQVGNGANS